MSATDHTLDVSIVTPSTTAYTGKALAVSVPGSKSPFQVLYNHAPVISSLDVGVIKIEDEKNHVQYFASKDGFVEVLSNKVSIIVAELVDAASVNETAAEQEVSDARERWNASSDRHERKRLMEALHWAEARYRAARLKREHA
jgi:F-type H+-transporting ATPase subunit epsilon